MVKRVCASLGMATLIAVASVAFGVRVVAPQLPPVVGGPSATATRVIERAGIRMLALRNRNGFVHVRRHAGETILVTASIRAYLRKRGGGVAEAEAYVGSLARAVDAGDVLTVITEPDERPPDLVVYADYTIDAPAGAGLDIGNDDGNVWVSEGLGTVRVTGDNTHVEVVRPGGAVAVRTTNGRIRVLDAPAGADLVTRNGNLYAHILGGALRAETTNGAIVARLLSADVTACDHTSANGGITAVLAEGVSARVDATTRQGIIRCDLPMAAAREPDSAGRLRGTIGEGRAQVVATTTNGNVWIAGEPAP